MAEFQTVQLNQRVTDRIKGLLAVDLLQIQQTVAGVEPFAWEAEPPGCGTDSRTHISRGPAPFRSRIK